MKAHSTALRAAVLAAMAALAAAPAGAQWPATVLSNVWSESTFYNSYKFTVHFAAGRYWAAFPDGGDSVTGDSCPGGATPEGPQRLRVYTSTNGTAWAQATYANPSSPPFDFCVNGAKWSFRFLGNVVVAFAQEDTGHSAGGTGRYYSKGTLDGSGTVTWQQWKVKLSNQTTDKRLTAAIVNGKPVLWASTQTAPIPPGVPGTPGQAWIGSSLDAPTWTNVANPTALAAGLGAGAGTNGSSDGAAVFPLRSGNPDDFIVVKATSWMTSGGLPANPGQSQRVVSIKYSGGAFDASWFNVSEMGGTIAEDLTTQVYSGDAASGTTNPDRGFAAAQQPDGVIHVVYVNQNGDIVHYRRGPGVTDATDTQLNGWVRLFVDVDGAGTPVSKVGLTVVDNNNLFLFYVRNTLPETLYLRRHDGKTWGAETRIRDGSVYPVDINGAIGTMETASGCSVGVVWNEGVVTNPWPTEGVPPVTLYFRPVNTACAAPTVYLRSIGTRPDYGTNAAEGAGTTVTVTPGSKTVAGTGTAWVTANRGMGDVIVIPCPNPPACTGGTPYMIANVASETSLTLTAPFASSVGTSYVIRRQFSTTPGNAGPALVAWEDCIDGLANGGACPYFAPASSSLVADNRVDIGVMYKDSVFDPVQTTRGGLAIRGSITSATNRIVLTVAPRNRHNGTPATAGCTTSCESVVYEGNAPSSLTLDETKSLRVYDANVTVEWIELRNFHGGLTGTTGPGPEAGKSYGVVQLVAYADPLPEYSYFPQNVALDHLLIHDFYDTDQYIDWVGVRAWGECCKSWSVRNTMIWNGDGTGIAGGEPGDSIRVENTTIDNMYGSPYFAPNKGIRTELSIVTARNTIVTRTTPGPPDHDYFPRPSSTGAFSTESSNNTSSDTSAPGANAQASVSAASLYVAPGSNLHLLAGAAAINTGLDLSSSVSAIDVDGQVRPAGGAWDRGADEFGSATAVRLEWLEARGADGAVEVAWRTGSEVGNLGFHLYRSLSADGPWTRLTSSLVPGQGFSATGASYAWLDSGLANGTRHFYRLEDVDASSVSTFHGPVSAVPQAGLAPPPPTDGGGDGGDAGPDGGGRDPGGGSGSGGDPSRSCPAWARAQLGWSSTSYACEVHGDPFATSFRVLSRSSRSAVVELTVGGFLAARDASGRIRALVPGLDSLSDPVAPALPMKRALLDGVVGRTARIGSVEAGDIEAFPGLVPAAVGHPQALVGGDGVIRAGRREASLPALSRGYLPRELARLAGEGFLGEEKTLTLEMTPLRFDASRGSLVLARRVVVRIDFVAGQAREVGRGRLGRRAPGARLAPYVHAYLATSRKGLHVVSFESLFPGRTAPLDTASLRLSRSAAPGASATAGRTYVPFHVEPPPGTFGPGSRLFFHADTLAPSTAFSSEVVYALEQGRGGVQMGLRPAAPDGSAPVPSRGTGEWETNRIYVPDVLEALDLWQGAYLPNGAETTKVFPLPGLDSAPAESARLVVHLQGGSDAPEVVDHHVEVLLGDALVAEASFDGAVPYRVEAEVPVSLLHEAANDLRVRNVGDTGVSSRVFLDRFEASYPQTTAARGGAFDGVFAAAGVGEVSGLQSPAAVVDVSAGAWLTGCAAGATVRFRAEAAHRYLAVSAEALVAPRVFFPESPGRLRWTLNQADYVVIGPRAFLPAAQPLLERRAAQGLTTFAASLEDIASSFGGGEVSARAIRDFLAFAYHRWQRPSPRYVLLLGDATDDPRHLSPSSVRPSPMPFLLEKTSYLWTASDPALATVNGDDRLPDLAIGRLPAATPEQARAMVAKILDWEEQGQSLDGSVALVADNPDLAGDFEADARDIESSFLQGRTTSEIFLGRIGDPAVARQRVLEAFDGGLSLISYVGHGGGATWASEQILRSWDAPSLLAQPRQPLMLTLSCLNGYFTAPSYQSLAESFLEAGGKGTIAAVSPSGLSLDGPAHLYHRAVVAEITSGRHHRLGDAILAAQRGYARTGALPELLLLYHLFGDPALRIRP